MDLGRGSLTVRVGSLMADTVEIENLTIEELDVHLEKNGDGYNYEKILEHVERGLARGGDEDGEPGGKKFIIREVLIRKIRVRYDVNLLGVTEAPVKFTISQRRYEDLGSGRGLGMGEVITLVISEVMSSVAKAGTELPGDLVKGLSKGVVAVGKGILDGVGGVFKKKK